MFKGWTCGRVSSPTSLLALSTSPNTSLHLLRLGDGNSHVCRKLKEEENNGNPRGRGHAKLCVWTWG